MNRNLLVASRLAALALAAAFALAGCSRPPEENASAPPDPAAIQQQQQIPKSEKVDQLGKYKGKL